jgi:DNA ligase-1
MNSDQVFDLIERVGSTSSTSAKVKLLKTNDNDTLRAVLSAALHPYVTYGITPTLWPTSGSDHFDERTWHLLKDLSVRSVTGNKAHDAVQREMERLTPVSAVLLYRVLCRDLRAGLGDGLVEKAFPGLLPSFSPMLAHKYDSKRLRFPAAVQVKLDGLRALAFLYTKERKAAFFTRSGHRFTSVPHLEEHLATQILDDLLLADPEPHDVLVFDGELTSGSFLDSVSALRKKNETASDAVFNVFDLVTGPQFEGLETAAPLNERIVSLELFLPEVGPGKPIGLVPHTIVFEEAPIFDIYDSFRSQGLEGVIVKPLDGSYDLKRSHNWMKIKAEESEDLEVIDGFEGTGKFAGTLGGFVVDFSGKSVRVGSGIPDALRDDLWRQHKDGLSKTGVSGLAGHIIEVAYHEVTPDGSLRHPRYKRFRDVVVKGVKA